MTTHRFLMCTAPFVAAAALAFTPALTMAKPHGGGGGRHAAVHSGGHVAAHSGGRHTAIHYSGHRAPAHYAAHSFRAYHGAVGARPAHVSAYNHNRGFYGRGAYSRGYYGRSYAGRGYYGHGYYGRGYYGQGYGNRYYGGGYYGGYGWSPWLGYPYAYSYSPYVNNYYDVAPSYNYDVAPYNDYVSSESEDAASDQPPLDEPSLPTIPANSPAELNVILPANGTVSFGDFQSQQAAGAHMYETPMLDAGRPYSYTIQASWMADGRPVTRVKTVRFQAGDTVDVDFTRP